MKSKTVLFFWGVIIIASGCVDKFKPKKEIRTECPEGVEAQKKLLFIGWDGVRSDALIAANTPNLDSLFGQAIYSFNVDRGPYTVSTPGWSSILHGVWPSKHGLTENSFRCCFIRVLYVFMFHVGFIIAL